MCYYNLSLCNTYILLNEHDENKKFMLKVITLRISFIVLYKTNGTENALLLEVGGIPQWLGPKFVFKHP